MTPCAFIVTVNLDDTSPTTLTSTASDILEDLQRAGHDVAEVKPWQRQSLVGDTSALPQQLSAFPDGNEPPLKQLF